MGQLFATPAMLWWTAAAAVPILIHLFSRRRYRRVAWAAMEFLARAIKRTRRRIRIENILLMLLRAAVLLFFALALADPQAPGTGILGAVGGEGRVCVVALDNSFSMDARDAEDRSRFDRARKIAADLLQDLDPQTDAAALLTIGNPAHLESHFTRDTGQLARRALEIGVGHGATDLAGALEAITGLLAEPDLASEFPGRRTVFVVTDMQKNAFVRRAPAAAEPGVPAAEPKLEEEPDSRVEELLRSIHDAGAETVFVDVAAGDEVGNVAVVSLEHSGRALVRGVKTTFDCRLRNFGQQTVSGELQLFIDDERTFAQSERIVDLKGRTTGTEAECEKTVTFELELPASGWHHLAARFVDDSLKIDNQRRFAFLVQEKIRVLAVSGGFAREGEEQSTFFVARALDPWLGRSRDRSTAFEVRETTLAALSSERIENADIVILADVPQLPPARCDELEKLVSDGGALIFFPGRSFEVSGRTGPNGTIDAQFHRAGQGLLPCSQSAIEGGDETTDKPYNLQFETFDHDATRYFEDPKIRPHLARMPVYRIAVLTPIAGDEKTRILASFVPAAAGTGAPLKPRPAIVERPFGSGRVVQFATSADISWTSWGASPAFVPLQKELAYHLGRRITRANILVGEPIHEKFASTITEVEVQENEGPWTPRTPSPLADQSRSEIQIRRTLNAALFRFRWKPLPGSPEAREPASRVVTVNVDPVESDLARIEAGYLATRLGPEVACVVEDPEDLAAESGAGQKRGLSRFLLHVVGAFLLIETLLAWRFGRNLTVETGT